MEPTRERHERSSMELPKILVCAYACSPNQGSEPGVGWGFLQEMAKFCRVWVIVEEEKFKDEIVTYTKIHPGILQRVEFHFIRKSRAKLLRKIWPPSYYWFYREWHKKAYYLAQQLHERHRFDLVHQLTMVGYREPGFLWKLDLPFVWGPIGGMGYFPWKFLHKLSFRGAIHFAGYNAYNFMQSRLLRRPKIAARCAGHLGNGLITATPDNRFEALKHWGVESTVLPEIGVVDAKIRALSFDQTQSRKSTEAIRLVWSGTHTPGKALNIALEALARLPGFVNWTLDILGSGTETERWKRLAKKLGIDEHCSWHGWVERDRALTFFNSTHLLIITSLRDLTSSVTIEGLENGLPIVCIDHCGFAFAVDDACGIKVPCTTPTQTIDGLSKAVLRLYLDEELRQKLSTGAKNKSAQYGWSIKGEIVRAIYKQKLNSVKFYPHEL